MIAGSRAFDCRSLQLLELMQRKVGGEHRALRLVRVPEAKDEDLRLLPRERQVLLKERLRLLNQIESALLLQGYREIPQTSRALVSWLQQPRDIGLQLRERLDREGERLALVESQIVAVEKRLKERMYEESSGAIGRIAVALMQWCSIGLLSAWILASEL
jgi:transposase